MNKLAIYFLGGVFGAIANVALWYVLPRIYSSTEISDFFIFFSSAELIGGILTFGGDAVLVRYFRKDLNKTNLYNLVIFTSFLMVAVSIFLLFVLSFFGLNFFSIQILGTGLLFALFSINLSVNQAEMNARKFVFLSNVRILLLCAIPFLEFVISLPHLSLNELYFGSLLLSVIISFFISSEKFSLVYNYTSYYFSYAIWSLATFILSYTSTRIMAYLMASSNKKNEELVIYLSFITVITLFNGLSSVVNRYFQVIKYKYLEDKITERIDVQLNFLSAFSFLCVLMLVVVSKTILFPYYFAQNSQTYFENFRLLIISLPFLFYYTFMYPYVYFKNKLWLPFIVNFCKILLQIVAFLAMEVSLNFLTIIYLGTIIFEVIFLLILFWHEYYFFKDLAKHILLSSCILFLATGLLIYDIEVFEVICIISFFVYLSLAVKSLKNGSSFY